ncbi:hypothetical protein NXH67_03425 [Butyrivibrio sp. DSM 10294]|uniref:hypothetical protein n=1 Tax=Butyrivibrio sp. DSM 10294 TaxID=2972457 RepID=UPI00234F20C4|nr:hypothetical protein [Butyrivibrio sp. DSM 10294]MDC7292564.1 hypothetical protein [Butyrivibrio sp. DSM 10294]
MILFLLKIKLKNYNHGGYYFMKKKFLAALLAATMALSMVACGSGTEAPVAEEQTPAQTQTATYKERTDRRSKWEEKEISL